MAPFQLLSETRLIYGIQEIYEFICEKYDDDDDDDDDVFFPQVNCRQVTLNYWMKRVLGINPSVHLVT